MQISRTILAVAAICSGLASPAVAADEPDQEKYIYTIMCSNYDYHRMRVIKRIPKECNREFTTVQACSDAGNQIAEKYGLKTFCGARPKT